MAAAAQDPKTGYHHGELPATLMSLALQHIEAHGTEKLSLRALAREAGVSPTAPYRHFPTKKCLLAALATQGFERLRERTEAVVESGADLDERFVGMGLAYVNFALDNPISYQLMFGSILGDFSEYDMLNTAAVSCYDEVQKMLQEVIDAKGLPQDVVQLGGVVWSGVHGMSSLLLNGKDQKSRNKQASPVASVAAMRADLEGSLRLMFAHIIAQPNR